MLKIENVSLERAGHVLFRHLNFSFNQISYGLVGLNGVGKSTLARLLVGEVEPDDGHVSGNKNAVYVPQFEERNSNKKAVNSRLLKNQNDDTRTLSGGEWMRVRLADAFTTDPDFLILDEPTNNLDREGKDLVLAMIRQNRRGLLVISHDREVLRAVDEIIELTPQGLKRFSSGFDLYWRERRRSREIAEAALTAAKKEKRKVELTRETAHAAQAKRARKGDRHGKSGSLPRIVAGLREQSAEKTTGRIKALWNDRVEATSRTVREAQDAVIANPFLRFDFEADALPASKIVFMAEGLNVRKLWSEGLNFQMRAQERWRLAGENGAGKSTLLKVLMGEQSYNGQFSISSSKVVYLDQDQSILNRSESVLETVGSRSRFGNTELRNELAFFGFTKEKVHQSASSLSGGERMRAALAKIFLGSTIPQVLLLDEPTNNLDFLSLEMLEAALKSFRGLLVIASHDEEFVSQIAITHTFQLKRNSEPIR